MPSPCHHHHQRHGLLGAKPGPANIAEAGLRRTGISPGLSWGWSRKGGPEWFPMWTTVATSLLAPQIHPHLPLAKPGMGEGKVTQPPPVSVSIPPPRGWSLPLREPYKTSPASVLPLLGCKDGPVLDFINKIFHSLKRQHPTSCSVSLCFPVTRLPWFCLVHQYIRRPLVSTLSGSDRVPGIQRQQDCSLHGGSSARGGLSQPRRSLSTRQLSLQ